MSRISVVYYSATGSVHTLAQAVAAGAREAGAEVRLRRVAELAPAEVIARNDRWREHLEETADLPVASVDDLAWADGFAFGTPTRFGQPASQLKQFLDTTSAAWTAGLLADKPAVGFTSAYERHGGHEATLLALFHTFCHWGAVIVPSGYVEYDVAHAAGGNPYGVSSIGGDGPPSSAVLESARLQGRRLAAFADALAVRTEEAA